MADVRNCEQCGAIFAPQREHARFCSARCRIAWNRRHASDSPAETGALSWSITAMRETIGRLCQASDWDRAHGFTVISEAVWWVTMVDATLMRYQPETYSRILAGQDPGQRRVTEEALAGLRFVRNQMGYHANPADFIESAPGPGIGAWTWKSVPEPAFGTLAPRGRDWEKTRYQAYQAQLAHRDIGETFTHVVAFLDVAAEGVLSRT